MSSPNLTTHQGASPEDAQLAGRSRPIAAAMAAIAIISPKMDFITKITPICAPRSAFRELTPPGCQELPCRVSLDSLEQIGNTRWFGSSGKRTKFGAKTMDSDQKSAWLRQLDEECPYQVVLPRQQLADDSEILDFLIAYVEKFDM
jgi:hypothetical protein